MFVFEKKAKTTKCFPFQRSKKHQVLFWSSSVFDKSIVYLPDYPEDLFRKQQLSSKQTVYLHQIAKSSEGLPQELVYPIAHCPSSLAPHLLPLAPCYIFCKCYIAYSSIWYIYFFYLNVFRSFSCQTNAKCWDNSTSSITLSKRIESCQ